MKNLDEFKISQLIRLTKIKLFTKDLLFFGTNLTKFNWIVGEYDPSAEGFVLFSEKNLSQLESGNIYLNNYYLSKPDYNYSNLVFLLCHELLHILNKHGVRREDRVHHVWCVACDHVVDLYLRRLQHITKPYNDSYNILKDLEYDIPSCTAEQAYEWLLKKQQQQQLKIEHNPNLNGPGNIQVFDANNNLLMTIPDILAGFNPTDFDNKVAERSTEQIISEARAILETLKQRGTLSGSLAIYLDELLKVEIPWERILEKTIKTNIIMKPDDRSWRNLNKYYMAHNLTLPGYTLTEDPEGVGILIIGTDTSGSINITNLKKFSYVILNSMKYFKEVYLFTHDMKIHQEKRFTKDNINEFYKFISKEGYKGRGGTSHQHLFEKIEQDFWKERKDELSMVICLTDGYSDIEYQYSKYDWIKNNIPLVFILTKSGKNSLYLDKTIGSIQEIKMDT